MGKLAAFFSVILPGGGQFVNKDFGKGLAFLLFVGFSLIIMYNVRSFWVLLFGLFAWVWSVFDAYHESDFLLTRKANQLLSRHEGEEEEEDERIARFEKAQRKLDEVISKHEKERIMKESPELRVLKHAKEEGRVTLDELKKALPLTKRELYDSIDLLIDMGKLEEVEKNVFQIS